MDCDHPGGGSCCGHFLQYCQHLHTGQGMSSGISWCLTWGRLCHSHWSEALGTLTWLAHVNNTSHTGLPLLLILSNHTPHITQCSPVTPVVPRLDTEVVDTDLSKSFPRTADRPLCPSMPSLNPSITINSRVQDFSYALLPETAS